MKAAEILDNRSVERLDENENQPDKMLKETAIV
jgi:hypothetical protein